MRSVRCAKDCVLISPCGIGISGSRTCSSAGSSSTRTTSSTPLSALESDHRGLLPHASIFVEVLVDDRQTSCAARIDRPLVELHPFLREPREVFEVLPSA